MDVLDLDEGWCLDYFWQVVREGARQAPWGLLQQKHLSGRGCGTCKAKDRLHGVSENRVFDSGGSDVKTRKSVVKPEEWGILEIPSSPFPWDRHPEAECESV